MSFLEIMLTIASCTALLIWATILIIKVIRRKKQPEKIEEEKEEKE